jgi:hypothetical protein
MPLRLGGLCLRPDFYLPDYDIIHEHFGLEEECYRRAAEAKISQYQRHGIGFSYTTAADEADIEEVLTQEVARRGSEGLVGISGAGVSDFQNSVVVSAVLWRIH